MQTLTNNRPSERLDAYGIKKSDYLEFLTKQFGLKYIEFRKNNDPVLKEELDNIKTEFKNVSNDPYITIEQQLKNNLKFFEDLVKRYPEFQEGLNNVKPH